MGATARTRASRIRQWSHPALSLAALLAASTHSVAAQSFDPGDESCAGKAEGTACWMQLSDQPQCYLWNHGLAIGASATWSAECNGGLAEENGTITWTFEGDKVQFEMGVLNGGRRTGRWVVLGADDSSGDALYYYTGPYVAGQRYGRWVFRHADGTSAEGSFVDGARQGHWVIRYASGIIGEGPYVDDAFHGRWLIRGSDGSSCAVEYVKGEQQGECK